MLQDQKVSIIVPIYNVEDYLRRCVDSLLRQTYRNLEIILVNDGSPDRCGLIANDYQREDHRVHVIHKENGGLSDARNVGIKEATGIFTMFVDSDDWLADHAIEQLVAHCITYHADIVQASFYYAYENKLLLDHRYYEEDDAPVMLNNRQLMYELVRNEKVKNFAWGKLYKTSLIKDIPFMKGVLFEDVFWAHQVMHKVDHYLIIHEPLFYYLQRGDSIVSSYGPRNLDILKGLKERHEFINKFYKELKVESYKQILKTSLIHYNLLMIHKQRKSTRIYRWEIESYIDDHYEILKKVVKDDPSLRRQLHLFSLHPYLNVTYLGLRKILRKIKVFRRPQGLKQVKI